MKKPHIYTDNSDLFDVEEEIKRFLKDHKKELNNEEHDELGKLLDRRAKAISDVLGVEVSSVTYLSGKDNRKSKP
jgi:hypothetical protein